MNWKNIIKRAVRTFIETALGYAAANVTGLIGEGAGLTKNALAALAVASVAAGLAALVNVPESSSRAVPDVEEIYGAREAAKHVDEAENDLPLAGQDEPKEGGNDGEAV